MPTDTIGIVHSQHDECCRMTPTTIECMNVCRVLNSYLAQHFTEGRTLDFRFLLLLSTLTSANHGVRLAAVALWLSRLGARSKGALLGTAWKIRPIDPNLSSVAQCTSTFRRAVRSGC